MAENTWLAAHPYLQTIAGFDSHIRSVLDTAVQPRDAALNWADHRRAYCEGVPLLASDNLDLESVDSVFRKFLDQLIAAPPEGWGHELNSLREELQHPDLQGAVARLVRSESVAIRNDGLFTYLVWTMMAHYLSDVVRSFSEWRNEEEWLRGYCPVCGALPSMAQLIAGDTGRLRLLVCGRCRAQWRYRRTGCPFCDGGDDQPLRVLQVEGDETFRIDFCGSCMAYLKTYIGQNEERIMLSDWTSVYVDILASDRGLRRVATSLYAL